MFGWIVVLCILTDLHKETGLPNFLKTEEIVRIAQRIPHKWKNVAYLTNVFERYEIENIVSSRVNEDETLKALDMLLLYKDKQGTRKKLSNVLKELNEFSLYQKILSGYFIDEDDGL